MSKCVIVFQEKQAAQELLSKLKDAQTPIINCDFVEPLNKQMDSEAIKLEQSIEGLTNTLSFNNVKLFNPNLARKDRQKALATWLIPFGFIAGLSFSLMTNLNTFSNLGFPNQLETILGGLLGMIAGWLGSFFSAGGINQENNDDIRALRKKSEQGFWLLILELPIEVELPWETMKEKNYLEIITLGKE